MTICLSYAPVIEEIIVKEMIAYLQKIDWSNKYKKFPNVRISNEYPWVNYMSDGWPDLSNVQETLFPSVTVVSSSDEESPADLGTDIRQTALNKDELADFKTLIANDGYIISSEGIDAIDTYFDTEDKLFGLVVDSHHRDHINLDIITDDPTNIRNRLYDLCRLFLTGPYQLELFNKYGIEIMNGTIVGSRTPEYNVEFGRILRGSSISFQVNYTIEQTFYETDVEYLKSIIVEHIPHTVGGE